MGKTTGFMEYERQDKPAESSKERIKHFREFHTPLSKEEQERQGARCMACGVPFCQAGQMIMGMASGCPLHNLVPEWNDLIYHGNWEEAYYRLKRRIIFRNSLPGYVLHFVRQHVHVDSTEMQYHQKRMSTVLLKMLTKKDTLRQDR